MRKIFWTMILLVTILLPLGHSYAELIVSPGIDFKIPSGGVVKFSKQLTTTNVYYEGEFFIFRDFTYGYGNWGMIGFNCETVNATMIINYVNPASNCRKITYKIYADTGVETTTKIYVGAKGEPTEVHGSKSWSYDKPNKILTAIVKHSSPQEIIVNWDPVDSTVEEYMSIVSTLYGLLITTFMATLILMALSKNASTATLSEGLIIIASLAIGGIIIIVVLNGIATL